MANHNPAQKDTDQDGYGDACDSDIDGDGVLDEGIGETNGDNCKYVYNPDQADDDKNGTGNACETILEEENNAISFPIPAKNGSVAVICL